MLTKRFVGAVSVALAAAAIGLAVATPVHAGEVEKKLAQPITVYKSPTCGCCKGWVDYLRADGFSVTVHDMDDLGPLKDKLGVGPGLRSCHTATVDGYVIEGHVPADDVRRLLSERPAIRGLAAPGMPQMSPGMASEIPKGYDVLGFDDEGRVSLYSRY